MRYEMMLPHQIRAAIAANTPVALPLGVLEYHGEHMAVGMDTLAVVKRLRLLRQKPISSFCRHSTMGRQAMRWSRRKERVRCRSIPLS